MDFSRNGARYTLPAIARRQTDWVTPAPSARMRVGYISAVHTHARTPGPSHVPAEKARKQNSRIAGLDAPTTAIPMAAANVPAHVHRPSLRRSTVSMI